MQIIVNKPELFPSLYARGQCNNNNGEEQQHRDRERKRGRDASEVNEVNRKSKLLCF